MALTDREVRSLVANHKGNKPAMHSDGAGLYLRVTGNGRASWYFRVKSRGKIHQKGFGQLSRYSLASAREIAKGYNEAVGQGRSIENLDPATVLNPRYRPEAKTFATYANEFIEGKAGEHRNLKAHAQWQSTIDRYCGQIAKKLPAEISYADVLAITGQADLRTKRETLERVLQRVRVILDYAAKCEGEPSRFNPAVAVRLPKRKPNETAKHFAAAPHADVATIMAALREKDSMSALVLRFSILTAARSGNVRNAEWKEIDEEKALWNIEGDKMKGGLPFTQPLSDEALEVLKLAKAKAPYSKRVFPGPQGGLISDVAINKTLRGIYPGVTAHGFRSSFRQWGAEDKRKFSAEALEFCLAHVQPSRVVRAYQRSDLLEERKLIMEAWSNYIKNATSDDSNVVSIYG